MKKYKVTLTLENIEAENEEEAVKKFEEWTIDAIDFDSYEVTTEVEEK